jgi:hypothetical protein
MTMDEAERILVNGVSYDPGHGRQDIIAATEVSNPEVWCASLDCVAHAPLNEREFARRGRRISSVANTGNTQTGDRIN